MEFRLSSVRVFRAHLAVIAVLVGAHTLLRVGRSFIGSRSLLGLSRMFDLDLEHNVPTLFSSLAMFAAAALLWATAEAEQRARRSFVAHWKALSVVFVFLAVDEALSLHERLNQPVREALGTSGVLTFAWVIPYAIAAAAFAMSLVPFLKQLDPRTRRDFIVAGAVYITGALVFEMLCAPFWRGDAFERRIYLALMTLEESFELLGIALFVRAIIAHNERRQAL